MESSDLTKTPVIFDTDMDEDCDDAGALAVLHALMDYSETNIIGIICNVPSINSAFVVNIINKYYNRPDIPIGMVKDANFETSEKYEMYRKNRRASLSDYYPSIIANEFNSKDFNEQSIWDASLLYRKLLSESEDNSVVIIAVGLLTALANLLDTAPDEWSPLNGEELVKKKVNRFITMGWGKFPSAMAKLNWLMDWEAARRVINHWPTPLVVTYLGSQFLNGRDLSTKTPISNPVRRCYEIYTDGEERGNYSWDLIAAYHGVRKNNDLFEEAKGYSIILEEELGKSHWVQDLDNSRNHSYLKLKMKRKAAKKILEGLLTKLPQNRS